MLGTVQSYFGAAHFVGLDQIRGVSYAVGTIYIIAQLWRPQPERRPIDPELRRYILALHERVEYDLRRMDA